MNNFGTVSYALAAVAFLALGLLLLTRWRERMQGSLLLPATLISAVWSVALSAQSAYGVLPLVGIFLLEISRDALWLAFLMRVLAPLREEGVPRWLWVGMYGLAALIFVGGLTFGVMHDVGAVVGSAGAVLIPGALLLSIVGFVLVEQVYRNTRLGQRWTVKLLWFGTGGLLAFDLCLYSTALLFHQIPVPMWEARGAANALCVPLLAFGVLRTPRWSPRVFMSRRPALYTLSIIGVGFYLLAMAIAGYYVREFGGSWGGAAQLLFLFAAGLLLVLVLFSGRVRAQVRVFATKHFSPYKYDYRAEWLRLTRTLSSATDESLAERVIRALGQIVNSDGGGVWIGSEEGMFVPAGGDLAGPDSPPVSATSEFLRFAAEREWITDLRASRNASGERNEPTVPDWLLKDERAWLIVPLLQEEQLIAFVVLTQPLAAQTLTWEDLDLLRTVARQAAGYIALHQAALRLAQSQQFEAYNRFAAFMMHDLKNLIAQQTLVVQNAARHRDNPQFIDDAISTIDNSVKRMNRLLEQLRRGETAGQPRRVNLAEVCASTVRRCSDRSPVPTLNGDLQPLEVMVSAERLAIVLEHVIRNAQDATSSGGDVQIGLRRNARHAEIEVVDTGSGMDAAFIRDRLFRPFDSTKGSQGMGIGAFQTREFARMAGGAVYVDSSPGHGTRFIIALPLATAS
jgi:putative PEP-CTERM system histidine kinase